MELHGRFHRQIKMGSNFKSAAEPFVGKTSVDGPVDAAPSVIRSRPAASRAKNILMAFVGLASLAIIAVVAYFFWRQQPVAPPTQPAPSVALPEPAPLSESVVRNPIEPPTSADVAPLPALADSDDAMRSALAATFSREALGKYFHLDDIVRRFVATVDNLPRQTVATRVLPLHPVPGSFMVASRDGMLATTTDNEARYTPYVQLLDGVDIGKVVAVYQRYYPLFQQAYVELGYPNGYFNDRLVEVIDVLLATPERKDPIALEQPKVIYQFADPTLEALAAGQKILLRMGPANAARVKAKLSEFRAQIAKTRLLN